MFRISRLLALTVFFFSNINSYALTPIRITRDNQPEPLPCCFIGGDAPTFGGSLYLCPCNPNPSFNQGGQLQIEVDLDALNKERGLSCGHSEGKVEKLTDPQGNVYTGEQAQQMFNKLLLEKTTAPIKK